MSARCETGVNNGRVNNNPHVRFSMDNVSHDEKQSKVSQTPRGSIVSPLNVASP